MNRSRTITIACLMLLPGMAAVRAQSSADSTLRLVRALYDGGSYTQAELEARRLLDSDLANDSLHVLAEQWVAFALVAQGRPVLAKEHFLNILRRQPAYDLDPVLTSPKILTVFNEARVTFRTMRPSPAVTQPGAQRQEGVTYRAIVFPGWEQLYQGRTTAGTIFLGAGVATLGTGIALEFVRANARNNYLAATSPEDIEATYQSYNRAKKAEAWAFGLFAAVYIASEIDVFANSASLTIRPTQASTSASGLLLTLSVH